MVRDKFHDRYHQFCTNLRSALFLITKWRKKYSQSGAEQMTFPHERITITYSQKITL